MLRALRTVIPRSSRPTVRLYHQNVVEHYENPRNVGAFAPPLQPQRPTNARAEGRTFICPRAALSPHSRAPPPLAPPFIPLLTSPPPLPPCLPPLSSPHPYYILFAGSLDKNQASVGTGLVGAPACGDVMKLQIQVGEDGRIVDAKFKTFGCGSAIASSSVATEWVKGRTVEECLAIKNTDIAAHLKLPPVKLHCSMLAEDAIKAAIKDYQSKSGK